MAMSPTPMDFRRAQKAADMPNIVDFSEDPKYTIKTVASQPVFVRLPCAHGNAAKKY
jgi:hypothetical protein